MHIVYSVHSGIQYIVYGIWHRVDRISYIVYRMYIYIYVHTESKHIVCVHMRICVGFWDYQAGQRHYHLELAITAALSVGVRCFDWGHPRPCNVGVSIKRGVLFWGPYLKDLIVLGLC